MKKKRENKGGRQKGRKEGRQTGQTSAWNTCDCRKRKAWKERKKARKTYLAHAWCCCSWVRVNSVFFCVVRDRHNRRSLSLSLSRSLYLSISPSSSFIYSSSAFLFSKLTQLSCLVTLYVLNSLCSTSCLFLGVIFCHLS
jgi:hypothetical protein